MAENPNVTSGPDGLEEVVVEASPPRYKYYNIDKILNHNLLKSSKFAAQFPVLPEVAGGADIPSEELTFLCDSVEFPGQTLTASEYRIPGKLKVKIPYLREMNEVTLSFYYSTDFPIYEIFSRWIENSSPTNTTNQYFDDIVCKIKLLQFDEVAGMRGFFRDLIEYNTGLGNATNLTKHSTVILENAFPLSLMSMPANWSDDGFHKLNVTFFYENMRRESGIKNFKFQDLLDSGNIVDSPTNSPSRPPSNIDGVLNQQTGPLYA